MATSKIEVCYGPNAMRWELLGTLGVFVDEKELSFRGQRPRDLLAILIIHRGSTISTETLIDEFWPEAPPPSARNSIQRFASDVRAGLGDERVRLVATSAGYRLEVHDAEIDVAEIERTMQEVSDNNDDPLSSIRVLRDVIARLNERLCAGSDHLPSVRAEAQRVQGLRVRAIEEAGSLAERHGIDLAEDLEEWFRDHPFNERIAGLLSFALARNGRQHDALTVHREMRSRLQQELGVSPGSELEQIEQNILSQELGGRLHRSRTLSTEDHQLIGRASLLDHVREVLDQSRLITLTGLGGVGKTALAIELAAWSGQASVARLADVRSADGIVESVALSLGLEPSNADRSVDVVLRNIAEFLASNEALLVIDNAEHLIDAVARMVTRLLEVTGRGRILVTSRERLAVAGESVVLVEPLQLADPGEPTYSPAVRLFASRGADTGAFTAAELLEHESSERVCRTLDGLPLAIELAAVQLSVFSPDELANRLELSMSALGRRRAAGRKGSLEDVLEWSWELLEPDEKQLLAELAVYRGWVAETVEFLEPMSGLGLLQSLVDKSLVWVERTQSVPARFSMLETVRQFAEHKLNESDEADRAHRRHATWMIDLATKPTLVESLIVAASMLPMVAERSNLLNALDWLRAKGDHESRTRLLTFAAGSVAHFGSALETHRHFLDAVATARELRQGPSAPSWLDDDTFGALLTAACDVGSAAADGEWSLTVGFEAVGVINGKAFDWAPGVLGTVATVVESVLLDHAAMSLLDDAERLAEHSPSPSLNQPQVQCWRGLTEMMNRRYESALGSFMSALSGNPPRGRVLLLAEAGAALSLLGLGRIDAARSFVETMRSQPDTDNWHYLVDIVASVVLGAVDPPVGLQRLEASLGPSGDSEASGYLADERIAAGVIAHHHGDRELSREMLSGSFGRTPVTLVLLVEYLDGDPWGERTQQQWTAQWRKTILDLFVTGDEPVETWVSTRPTGRPVRKALSELRHAPPSAAR